MHTTIRKHAGPTASKITTRRHLVLVQVSLLSHCARRHVFLSAGLFDMAYLLSVFALGKPGAPRKLLEEPKSSNTGSNVSYKMPCS
eukprot:6174929-Pleurochrysis_carterae.AAC.1